MFKISSLQVRFFLPVIVSLILFPMLASAAKPVKVVDPVVEEPVVEVSALTTDIQSLVSQGNDVNILLSALSLSLDTSCSDLGGAIASVESFNTSIESVSGGLTAPLTLDADSLTALDDLSLVTANIASVLPILSGDISAISTSSDMADIDGSLAAMLSLSEDIGTMADRILEMGDKILVMADNIGLMADRIILTQEIQSTNMALTQASILSTQQNMIMLNVTVDTSAYNLPMTDLVNTGDLLALDMNNTTLTETNMNVVLANFESRISSYLNDSMLVSNIIDNDRFFASANINADTLTMMGDLSVINASLAASLNRFSQAMNTLAPGTDTALLNDSAYSMLRLAADIGLMGNRITEMGDNIIIMADNMGLMTLNIVNTQTLQTSNLGLTQSNISTAQINTVTVISAFGL